MLYICIYILPPVLPFLFRASRVSLHLLLLLNFFFFSMNYIFSQSLHRLRWRLEKGHPGYAASAMPTNPSGRTIALSAAAVS